MTPLASLLSYGGAGFVLGVPTGWLLHLRYGRPLMSEPTAPARSRRRPPAWLATVLGVLALVISITGTVLVVRQSAELSACLRAVTDTTNRRLNASSQFAKEDREAVDRMVKGVITPGPRGHALEVLQGYLAGRAERDAARAKLPSYPLTKTCDD